MKLLKLILVRQNSISKFLGGCISIEKAELVKDIINKHRLFNRFVQQYNPDIWMGLNLTIAQVKSLFFIANGGRVNFRMLASAMKVTPSNVTGIIDRLVEQELVSRTTNPEDRRMLMLELTDKGATLIVTLRETRVNQMSSMLDQLTWEELTTIAQGFTLLSKAIETYGESK